MPHYRIDPTESRYYEDRRRRPKCSECRGPIDRPFNKFTRTCSAACELRRKTRLQRERRRLAYQEASKK
jgi:hypothetical protein